jgi:ABC-type cobalamin transport system permease subunit
LFVGTLMVTSHVLLGQKVSSKHIREPFTNKATVTLGIIVVAYVVTWAPFFVTNVTESVCRFKINKFNKLIITTDKT